MHGTEIAYIPDRFTPASGAKSTTIYFPVRFFAAL